MSVPPELLGPVGALVLAIAVIGALVKAFAILWREHLEADVRDRAHRDEAIAGWKAEQTINGAHAEATRKMAESWNRRIEADGQRKRRGDGD